MTTGLLLLWAPFGLLLCFFYPMVRTDASEVGAGAGAEVERSHREAASVQTHHVGPTGSAILHIAQV